MVARYRCTACGNLTRFDVTRRRRTRAFHHYTLGGDLAVEHEEVLADEVEEVACRWCDSTEAVVQFDIRETVGGEPGAGKSAGRS